MQRHAAPPLAPDSPAYRYGGFGTTEVVLYFDLVRALFDEARQLATAQPSLASLVERLADFRDVWLAQPNESTGPGRSAAELIEAERRRMPITAARGRPVK